MEVKVVEMDGNYVKLEIRGEDHTYLNLLQHYLLEDEDVEIARYYIPHPLQDRAELVVKTKSKNPLEAIKEANEKIVKACDELLAQI
ncbi:RpoL/Rpb11 RNA polymerase subunit family protein [Archaeoglobus profundus]|uniref:DNA-directed RNA polymerase subunit Rpo11 n=1 Tax=Archaeoglobus profundus (strain DSM 5631 / JCM 9629 / NBRC 100127 / Av18) TaxID=572546 RepID=D2RHL4_ARCPA|nr:DNA-directed RNA polymerase subunit L [Archaeoglobus profundus]ADB57789.1 RNA polymerase dimerization [Archaeoglobus profundus DSM 5631]